MTTDKDNEAFRAELILQGKKHGPLNMRDLMLIATAWADGRDAHAERVKPLIEIGGRLADRYRREGHGEGQSEITRQACEECQLVLWFDALQQPAESAEPVKTDREGEK